MADHGGGSVSGSSRFWCSIPEKLQLHGAMLALQFGYAGFHVVSRAALNMGISKLVFLVYRNIIAFFLLLPFAYFLEKYFATPFSFLLLLLLLIHSFIMYISFCFHHFSHNSTHYFMFSQEGTSSHFFQFSSSVLPSCPCWVCLPNL